MGRVLGQTLLGPGTCVPTKKALFRARERWMVEILHYNWLFCLFYRQLLGPLGDFRPPEPGPSVVYAVAVNCLYKDRVSTIVGIPAYATAPMG